MVENKTPTNNSQSKELTPSGEDGKRLSTRIEDCKHQPQSDPKTLFQIEERIRNDILKKEKSKEVRVYTHGRRKRTNNQLNELRANLALIQEIKEMIEILYNKIDLGSNCKKDDLLFKKYIQELLGGKE